MPHQTFVDNVSRDLRDARRSREEHGLCIVEYEHRRAELRLTIMQSQIRLAEIVSTLRRISRFVDALEPQNNNVS